jgi:CheY-like chemotaxis protein
VLVVDDDADMGEMVATFVRRLGHQPVCVQNPEEGIARMAGEEFALVLTDVQMGSMDGIALCEHIA